MARNRPPATLLDYLVAAIEPVLIMVMVGSLMFFLLDLLYDGPYLERLRWIFFWFVFGIVLITRVSMQIGTALALGYGVALGSAVAVVASVLTGFHPILLVILGAVWWATHNLTLDCTLLPDDQDAGVGLLQDGGLDLAATAGSASMTAHDDPAAMDASILASSPGWKLAGGDKAQARRPHAPGVWLIYFTLASLPVFALGQWFVPSVQEERRAGLFLYFIAYIASAMGLLLATSFLNLRRYLRQRRVKMPAAMTATWLTTGAGVIVGLTLLAAVFPFSGSGFSILKASTFAQNDTRASKYAVLKDSGVQGEGARSEGRAASRAQSEPAQTSKAEGSGQTNDKNAQQQTSGKGRAGGSSGPGQSKTGAPRGKSSSGKDGAQGKQGSPKDRSGETGKGKNGSAERQAEGKQDSRQDADGSDKSDSSQQDEGPSGKNQETSDAANPPQSQAPMLPSLLLGGLSWLRGLIIAIGVLALIYAAIRHGQAILQALVALLASLFGGFWIPKQEKKTEDAPTASEPAEHRRPFSSFVDPFETGLDRQFSPSDLVVYSFEALESWAWEHSLARSPQETPMEFARRLGQARDDLRQDSARLVAYFIPIAYGQRDVRPEALPALRQFWRTLQTRPS
jgi:Domain of unknown function (DUF4129)